MNRRPERVLMTADTVGGVWQFALELSRGLRTVGVEVALATMGKPLDRGQRAEAEALSNLRLFESSYRLEWMKEPWDEVRAAGEWLRGLEESLRPDLIHLNGYVHAALPWRAPVLLVGHSCVYSWFEAVKGHGPPPEWSRYREAVGAGLRAAGLVTAPTRVMLEALRRHYGGFRAGAVVPNGRGSGARPDRKEPLLMAVGRLWDEAKNIAVLEAVAPHLPWPVRVAGETEHPDGGRARFDNLQLLGKLGRSQLALELERTSIFVLPARYEPFGLSALEAGLAGAALVLGDIPSLREVWGDAAEYVPPGDGPRLLASLLDLIEQNGRRQELARRARARALRYSPQQLLQGYLGLYAQLLGETPRRVSSSGGERVSRLATRSAPLAGATRDGGLSFAFFYHSLISDWNHGNAHFLRGVVSELLERGHQVRVYEPRDAWSVQNLLRDHGERPLHDFRRAYPGLQSIRYDLDSLDLARALDGVDVVLVHEWNDRRLVERLGQHRRWQRQQVLLFHDTHHRSVSRPQEMSAYDLKYYDGLLAFGEVIRQIYLSRRWIRRAWTWHEAADPRIFRPRRGQVREGDLVWIGNWGDDERTAELREFLLGPVQALGLRASAYGVRYPASALAELSAAGIRQRGWLPNYRVPEVFARYAVTVHIPRRPYLELLPGIPTIRPFEALACGIPLVSSPWDDLENLFTPGEDFLVARSGAEMKQQLRRLLAEPALGRDLAERGRRTVMSRHTCAHRVDELLAICAELGVVAREQPAVPALGGGRVAEGR